MVKNFKGIVKISDIQNEFDNLVTGLNTAVDTYNSIKDIEGVDYTKGGSILAPLGYTLTIGGLKQFMEIYDGCAFGVRVFKTGNNECKPTKGVLITKDNIYRIPDNPVTGYGTALYYNPKTHTCQVGGTVQQVRNVTFPKATSNSNPFTISTSYNATNGWKAFSGQVGLGKGWSMGTTDGDMYGFTATNGILTAMKNATVFNIDASLFYKRLTFSYKSPITVNAGTVFSYDIKPQVDHNLAFMAKTPLAYGLGIDNDKVLRIGRLDSETGTVPDYSFNMTRPDYQTIRVTYTFKKKKTFKSLTLGIAPFLFWSVEVAVRENLFMQNAHFSGSPVQTIVTVTDTSDHNEVYKIADLNWNKTTADKLYLNDLPHTMF